MGKVAVLADIHGNLPALEAVLDEAAALGLSAVALGGDLADGPFPAETMARLLALGPAAAMVRGNSDRWLVEARTGRGRHRGAALDALIHWTLARLGPAHMALLAALPLTRHLPGAPWALCHATARHDNEMFLVDAPLAQADAAFATLPAPAVLLGHSHMPFDRLFNRRRIVNVGSVGMAYGHAGASWAVVEGDTVTLRRTAYDTRAAARRIAASGMPDAEGFIRDHVMTTSGDAEALADFAAVAARQQATGMFD